MPDPHSYNSAKDDSKVSAPPKQADAWVISTLARLYWMLVGNGILVLLALAITRDRRQHTLTIDAAFWAVVVSLVLVRYLDVALLGGKTASGEPASLGDWYRYSRWLLLLAVVVWIVLRAVPLMGRWLVPAQQRLHHARSHARLDERHVIRSGYEGIVVASSMLLIALVLIGIAKLLF